MTITEESDTLILRIKDLNPDLSSWEAQEDCVSSTLKHLKPGHLQFDHFSYEKRGADQILAQVDTQNGDQLVFEYKRI